MTRLVTRQIRHAAPAARSGNTPATPGATARRGTVGAAALWLLLGCAALVPALAHGQGLKDLFMPRESEKQIGASEHARVVAEFGGVHRDAALAAYVTSVGQLLASTSQAPDVGYTFTILNSEAVNAFALPGGYVYVTRGLLALASSEAELAGVLAHEIGHVVARHGADRYSKGVLASLGLAILGAATDSSAALNIAQLGAGALLSSYSREDEFEADRLGVSYLTRAGFEPVAMASFLRKMERYADLEAALAGRGSSGADFFATHPRTADRVERARSAARGANVRDPIVARDIYQRKIDGLLYGPDPRQGYVAGQRFVHPEIGFELTVPPGFEITNQPTQVLARRRDGAAIRLDMERLERPLHPLDYVRRVWPAAAPAVSPQQFTVNGMTAATAAATVQGQSGPMDLRLVAIRFDAERMFRLLFLTPPRTTADLEVALRRTTFSFKPVDTAGLPSHGLRIALHTVAPGEDMRSLAGRMALREQPRERFAVLNGLEANDRLTSGARVKLVVRGAAR